MWRIVLITIILFSGCNGCEKVKNNDQHNGDMIFNVDNALLSEAYIDPKIGISFNPPRFWLPVSDSVFKVLRERTRETSNVSPLQFFYHDTTHSACIISIVDSLQTLKSEAILARLKTSLQHLPDTNRLEATAFNTRDFHIYQVMATTPNVVYFRLIFQNPRIMMFQLDYFVPFEIYATQIKAIESSIGSVKPR